jgi:hypothetical protein
MSEAPQPYVPPPQAVAPPSGFVPPPGGQPSVPEPTRGGRRLRLLGAAGGVALVVVAAAVLFLVLSRDTKPKVPAALADAVLADFRVHVPENHASASLPTKHAGETIRATSSKCTKVATGLGFLCTVRGREEKGSTGTAFDATYEATSATAFAPRGVIIDPRALEASVFNQLEGKYPGLTNLGCASRLYTSRTGRETCIAKDRSGKSVTIDVSVSPSATVTITKVS